MKEKISKVNTIIIILMAFQIIIALLPYFGIAPLNKPTNLFEIAFKFLLYKVPLIWIIILVTLFTYLLLKRRRVNRYDDRSIIDKITPDEIDIDLRSHADQIVFYIPYNGIPSLQIWLKVINKSSLNLMLDKLIWELGVNQFVKKQENPLSKIIGPKGIDETVLIELNLTDSEAKFINNIDKNNIGPTYFKGIISASSNGYSCKKEFNLDTIKFEIRGAKKEEFQLTEEHHWALLTLLSKQNQEESKDILEQEYCNKFNKGRIDFNILRGDLLDHQFIEEQRDYHPLDFDEKFKWVLTRKGLNIAKEKHKPS